MILILLNWRTPMFTECKEANLSCKWVEQEHEVWEDVRFHRTGEGKFLQLRLCFVSTQASERFIVVMGFKFNTHTTFYYLTFIWVGRGFELKWLSQCFIHLNFSFYLLESSGIFQNNFVNCCNLWCKVKQQATKVVIYLL